MNIININEEAENKSERFKAKGSKPVQDNFIKLKHFLKQQTKIKKHYKIKFSLAQN